MRIYTKTGDKGKTSLYDASRVSKSNKIIETLGAIDELNCELGLILACASHINDEIREICFLRDLQHLLFSIGSIIATPKNKHDTTIVFDKDDIVTLRMERFIDKMTETIPVLRNFILPGTSINVAENDEERRSMILVSQVHRARAVCRRAETHLVSVAETNKYVEVNCLKFMNRLSDYLFTLSRFIARQMTIPEVIHRS